MVVGTYNNHSKIFLCSQYILSPIVFNKDALMSCITPLFLPHAINAFKTFNSPSDNFCSTIFQSSLSNLFATLSNPFLEASS